MDVLEELFCRVCGGRLEVVYDLGALYVSNFVSKKEDAGDRVRLRLSRCKDCGLVQLKDTVRLDDLYRRYWYRSGLNKSMLLDLKDVVNSATKYVDLAPGDVVCDIGTNDGSLLSFFPDNIIKIGFDPAYNLIEDAKHNSTYFINDYFHDSLYPINTKAKIVTAIAMFYDLNDPKAFVESVRNILHQDGVFIIQLTDYMSMLKNNMIDAVCHEHLEYYKLIDIIQLLNNYGLKVFRCDYNNVNGGSLRVYAAFPFSFHIEDSVLSSIRKETTFLSSEHGTIESFKERINQIKNKVVSYISSFGKKEVYALGASTKGNTLLQVFGLDNNKITAIGEINKEKIGMFTVGTNIPIISEEDVIRSNPKLIVILPYHFFDTFSNKLSNYIKSGGKVLFPLPNPRVLTNSGEVVL